MGGMSHMDQVFLKNVTDVIDSHIDDESFGVSDLCKKLGVSRSKLHRKLNSITGKSASKFIREFRLERAMTLLKNDEATAAEIAYSVGFRSPSYFSSSFHNYFGFPPSDVKKRQLESPDSDEFPGSLEPVENLKSDKFYKRSKLVLAGVLFLFALFLIRNYMESAPDSEGKLEVLATDSTGAQIHSHTSI